MDIKKSLVVLGAATTLGIAGIGGLGIASAATNGTTSSGNSLASRIAEKFNLNESDVQSVIDEERAAHEAERQQKVEEHLTQAVRDGKITEEQKAKILAKLEELQSNREAWKGKTPEERQQAMKERHDSLKKWADENGIPMRYLHVGHGGPGRRPPPDAIH